MWLKRVLGVRCAKGIFEFAYAGRKLVYLFVEVLGGGEDESRCAK